MFNALLNALRQNQLILLTLFMSNLIVSLDQWFSTCFLLFAAPFNGWEQFGSITGYNSLVKKKRSSEIESTSRDFSGHSGWEPMPKISDSRLGCCGTQGCHKEMSGVPPNIELTAFFNVVLHRVLQIVIFR